MALRVGIAGVVLLGLLAAISVATALRHEPDATVSQITVVYVGADDCAPCRAWHRDYWPSFSNSPEFNHLVYREVKSPHLFSLLDDEYWPEDLRTYRTVIDPSAGAPLWLVIADGKVLVKAWGVSAWADTALPKIASLVRHQR